MWFKIAYMNPKFRKDTTFDPVALIDAGGVGEAVSDVIKRLGVPVRGIKYTGGDGFKVDGYNVSVSKVLMVSTFLGISEGGRFTMPSKASFESLFKGELRSFRGELTKLGKIRFEAEEGAHDDLVMSVAQAIWFSERFIRPQHYVIPEVIAVSADEILNGPTSKPLWQRLQRDDR